MLSLKQKIYLADRVITNQKIKLSTQYADLQASMKKIFTPSVILTSSFLAGFILVPTKKTKLKNSTPGIGWFGFYRKIIRITSGGLMAARFLEKITDTTQQPIKRG